MHNSSLIKLSELTFTHKILTAFVTSPIGRIRLADDDEDDDEDGRDDAKVGLRT